MNRILLLIFILASLNLSAQTSLDSLKMITPEGHTAEIESAAFNLKEDIIVSVSGDNSIVVWDRVSGKLLNKWIAHEDIVYSVEFDSSSKQILSASADGFVKIWNVHNGELVKVFDCNKIGVYYACFSPDNNNILVSNFDGSIKLINCKSGKLIKSYIDHKGRVYSAIFSSDGSKILSCSRDNTAKIWDVDSGKLLKTFNGHNDWVFKAVFGNDNNVITCSKDNFIINWSIESGKILRKIKAHEGSVNSLDMSYDGKYLVSCSADYTIKLWDIKNNFKLLNKFEGHKFSVNSISFSKDSRFLLSASSDGTLRIWSFTNLNQTKTLKGNSIKISNSQFFHENNLLSILADNSIVRWKITDPQFNKLYIGHQGFINSVDFSKDEILLTAALDNTINIWDKNGSIISSIEPHIDFPFGAKFNSDFTKILSFSVDNSAKLSSIESKKILADMNKHSDMVYAGDFYCNDKFIVTESMDSSVILWDSVGSFLNKFKTQGTRANSSKIDKNCELLAIANNNGTIYIWNLDDYSLKYKFYKENIQINSIVFSPNSEMLFSADNNGNIFVWDIIDGSLKNTIKAHKMAINNLLIASNRMYLISKSDDMHVKVWNVLNGKLIYDLNHKEKFIYSVHLNFDNTLLITTTSDHKSLVWSMSSGNLIFERIQLENNNYLVKLPNSPYYMCSKDASKMLHYVTPSLKVIGFEQLDPVYNRPDIVLDSIGKYFGGANQELVANYRQSWEKRIDRLGLDKERLGKGEIAVPNAEIVGADDIAYENKEGKLEIKVLANDPKYSLRRFNVFVNEVPLYGSAGISIAHMKKQVWDTTVSVSLSVGENKIQVSVMNELGLENFKYPTYVNYTPEKEILAKTHYIGIGVNEFKDTEHNLKYCVKDVTDLAKSFGGTNTVVKLYTDKQVTKENILALKEYLNKTSVNDKVIISCSSHGLLDDSLNFYLAMHDVDFNNPKARGLKYEELESLLDGIPARQKLLLLDACNSGENDKTELLKKDLAQVENQKETPELAEYKNKTKGVIIKLEEENKSNFKKMNELFVNVRNNTGSVIISAAGGQESALEAIKVDGKIIENGAFTYSILECLKQNEGKELKVNTLKQYAEKRVEEITNGKQKPTSRQETMEVDWGVR